MKKLILKRGILGWQPVEIQTEGEWDAEEVREHTEVRNGKRFKIITLY